MTERFEQALADGQITQEQLDNSLANASDRIEKLISNFQTRSPDREANRPKVQNIIGVISEILGLDPETIVAQIQDGATLSEIIETGGSSVAAVVDFFLQQTAVRLDEAVAQGDITQEQADATLARTAERIETLIAGSGAERDGKPNVRATRTRPSADNDERTGTPGLRRANPPGLARANPPGLDRAQGPDKSSAKGRGNQPAPNGNNLMTIVLEIIGVGQDEVRAAPQEGISLGELAASLGFDLGALTDQIVDAQAARFSEDGRGNFDADRADRFLEKTRADVERFLNRTQGAELGAR